MKKGTIIFTALVRCGRCETYMTIEPGANCSSEAGVRRNLKQAGWRRNTKEGFVCSTCLYAAEQALKQVKIAALAAQRGEIEF